MRRMPDEGCIVDVSNRNQSALLDDTTHLAKRRHRIGEMLQHLVREDDIDRSIFNVELVDRTPAKPEVSEREIAAIESALPKRVRILVGGRAATAPPDSRAQIQQDLALVEAALSS